jgi:drug/metabolite transporter (DMT)-like permease
MKTAAMNGPRLQGILLLVASVTVFAGVDALSKVLVQSASVSQTLSARFVFALPFLLAVTPFSHWMGLLRTSRPFLQILRGSTPVIVSLAIVIGVQYLPLADTTVVVFSAPFLVVTFSGVILGERVGMRAWAGVILGFLGVLAVTRPGTAGFSPYMIFPGVAAIFYAMLMLVSRRLVAAGDSATTTLAWTLLVGIVATTPMAALDWKPVSATAWLLAFASGATFFGGQYLITKAFEYAPANILAPFTYFQILAATVLGILFFDEYPDSWTWIGIAIITVSGIYVARRTGEKAA